jgi:leucyl aminopeptidase
MDQITTVFFDLGDTLGIPVLSSDHRLERIDLFEFTKPILEKLRDQGIRLGIISNTGNEPGARVNDLLCEAGILTYFEEKLLIYSGDVGVDKKSTTIFALAVQRAEAATANQCLFVGEDAAERKVARMAGLAVCPHPQLIAEVLQEEPLSYIRLKYPAGTEEKRCREMLRSLPVVPLHAEGNKGATLYAISSHRAIPTLMNMQFGLTPLGSLNEPLWTDAYLFRDDRAREAGALQPAGEASKFAGLEANKPTILHAEAGKIFVALPAEVSLDQLHLDGGRHGHTLRLMAKPELLKEAPPPPAGLSALQAGFVEGDRPLPEEIAAALAEIQKDVLLGPIKRFTGATPLSSETGDSIVSRHVNQPDNKKAVAQAVKELEDFFVGPGQDSPEPDASPNYLKKTDTVANIDTVYAADIARVVGAAAWVLATMPGSNQGEIDA